MTYSAGMRVWRGGRKAVANSANSPCGGQRGQVVLDDHPPSPHNRNADTGSLLRWNCKSWQGAGPARPNQRQTATDVHDADVDIRRGQIVTVTPMRTFPVIRDLVTPTISFNCKSARDPSSRRRLQPSEYRRRVDVARS